MNQEQATMTIANKLSEAHKLIQECEEIADKTGVEFSFHGPSYGMGGYYMPKTKPEGDEDWNESDAGWQASSQSC